MLFRHKTILFLLTRVPKPLTRTVFVKLVFLLRYETDLRNSASFYDFVPYKYGPFSFTLYRDLDLLRQEEFISEGDEVALCVHSLERTRNETGNIPASVASAVNDIVDRYSTLSTNSLIGDVYRRYPWFALNSELPERNLVSPQRPERAKPAVYTVGYEGKSVDAFFNDLLSNGIDTLIDVRANPISRKYGFSKLRLSQFCDTLGLEYCHLPNLGISRSARTGLGSAVSYRRLLSQYAKSMLPEHRAEVDALGSLMRRTPSVIMCVEKNVECCHRSRLANAVADTTGLEVVHL